jgi:UDP-N-acetylglucosamine 2-epimerase (non-hydrolysing)
MKILHVVGARPNFMKLAPLHRTIRQTGHEQFIIHTGQHYDAAMSDIFFTQLAIPQPDFNLGIGSGSHTEQTAKAMLGIEDVLKTVKPDWVVVYGDVNSTLAASLVCTKNQIRLAHVEAGLRSFDRKMPEEINRILTDQMADVLFTPSEDGNRHLLHEGIAPEKIFLVGNIMIDSLVWSLQLADSQPELVAPAEDILQNVLKKQPYVLATVHRPSNVDEPAKLRHLLENLMKISREIKVLFPVHPRTRKQIAEHHLLPDFSENLHLVEPVGYLDFLVLQKKALAVITDSGGIQEETSYLKTPCLTIRTSTERPVTVEKGTNILLGEDFDVLPGEIEKIRNGEVKKGENIPLWDGKTAERITEVLLKG